jgi:hypothetical protein
MAFRPGFDIDEAKALLALIADLQGPSPPLPQPPVPADWRKLFDPPPIGPLDNKWQLWQDTGAADRYAVVIRGTVYSAGSIGEDLMAVMVAGSGELPAGKVKVAYRVADEPRAAVHLGFLVGALLLLADGRNGILARLASLPAGSDIFVTGHSQGAGIATLVRAFLHYAAPLANLAFNHKIYVFAQPKPGNDHFGDDFERAAGIDGAFRVSNDQDWVPQVPFTIQLPRDINEPNPLDLLQEGILGLLPKAVGLVEEAVGRAHRVAMQPKLAQLETVLAGATPLATAPAEPGEAFAIVPTLNYAGCGVEIVRAGTPGANPDDPKDFMWQHHAAMYYRLLEGDGTGQ